MKKIRCPRCDVINLEGFVTYPNCAGCGALLPQAENEYVPFWRRRAVPLVWAPALGVVILAIMLISSRAFERPEVKPAAIVMLGRVPRVIQAGDIFTVTLTLDAIDGEVPREDEPLNGVRLRIPREVFRRFAFISLEPMPDEIWEIGTGRYFAYGEMTRGSQIKMRLRSLRLGRQPLSARVYEQNQTSANYSTTILVRPAAGP